MNESIIRSSGERYLGEGQILILEPENYPVLDQKSIKYVRSEFSRRGYELLYLPEIFRNIDEDIVSYFAPERISGGMPPLGIVQRRIEVELELIVSSPTAILSKNNQLCAISDLEGDETTEDFLDLFIDELSPRHNLVHDLKPEYEMCECEPKMRESPRKFFHGNIFGCEVGAAKSPDESYDIENLISELCGKKKAQLRDIGLSEAALRFLMGCKIPKLSRIAITRRGEILLEDYGRAEIKMDDKTKALYFLYLRHPEGIAIKELPRHRQELMDLYQSISGRDDKSAMKRTVENLSDPYQNDANISLSRIKKAFCEIICDSVAKNYYVAGIRGGERKVVLDRSLITWETIRK